MNARARIGETVFPDLHPDEHSAWEDLVRGQAARKGPA